MDATTKALAILIAVNTQAAILVWLAFWLKDVLDEKAPLVFSWGPVAWGYVLGPLVCLAVVHSYYVMIRYLMRLDESIRKKKKGPNGEDGKK